MLQPRTVDPVGQTSVRLRRAGDDVRLLIVRLLLVLSLLAAHQASFTHALSHVDRLQSGDEPSLPVTPECLAFHFAAATPGAPPPPPLVVSPAFIADVLRPEPLASSARTRPFAWFSSRAPPFFS
jgi:hypothetical protein